MPPRNIPPISAPDTPNPWLKASASTSRAARTEEAKAKADTPNPWLKASASTSQAARTEEAKAKAREEQRSATTKDHVIEMLGEFNNLPVSTPADPEHRDNVSAIPNKTEERYDWPNDLIDRIKQVMGTPCSTPSAPEFKFEISTDAMQHN